MALFKIFNNIDSRGNLPNTYTKGYMYFDAVKGLFYIDTAGEGGTTGTRMAVNAWGALTAENDSFTSTTAPYGQNIASTYIKGVSVNNDGNLVITKGNNTTTVVDCSAIAPSTAEKVAHTLTFGANQQFVYDGSEDVVVPVYTGSITN